MTGPTAAANRLTAICEHFETYGVWPRTRAAKRDASDLRAVLDEREQLAARVAEMAKYRLAADTEPDDELTRIWPTVDHLPCGAGVFGYDPMDADELDLATLLRVVAEHRCAPAAARGTEDATDGSAR